MSLSVQNAVRHVRALLARLAHFPWRSTVRTLGQRFQEDRLGLTASSLTFTTILALVPFATVALAAFTAFPIFGKAQEVLQRWLMGSVLMGLAVRMAVEGRK